MTAKVLLSILFIALIGGTAGAESTGQRILIERASQPQRQEGAVRVQLSTQLFLPGPTDDSEDAEKRRERARRALYDLASKECDVLREIIARDCQLDSINITLNRQSSRQMQGYSVAGSMTFQITLK